MIFAVGDAVWTSAIAGTGAVALALIAWAVKKLDAISKTGEKTHLLVNSASLTHTRLYAAAVRRIAVLTKETEDIRVADEAEKALTQSEIKAAVAEALALKNQR